MTLMVSRGRTAAESISAAPTQMSTIAGSETKRNPKEYEANL